MSKNRFFKTTVGVAFELVVGVLARTAANFPSFQSFVQPLGSGGSATTTLTTGSVTAITLVTGGSGWLVAPTVVFTGGGPGTGAIGTATITGGIVTAVALNAGGAGYTSAPTVSFVAVSANVGDYQAFVDDGTSSAKGLTFGTALTAPQKRFPIRVSYVTEKSGGACTVTSPTPLIGETIVASLSAYKAPSFQDAKIVRVTGTAQLGQELVFKLVETTPLTNLLPTYDYAARIITTFADALATLVASINKGSAEEFFTATAIADGIQVVSKDETRHFRLAMNVITNRTFPVNDTNWQYTVTTPAYAGSGTVAQVKQLEVESNIKRGITTQYPGAGLSPLDFGSPVSVIDIMVGTGITTFDVVTLVGSKRETSPTPLEHHSNKAYLFIVVPAGQGAAIVATFA